MTTNLAIEFLIWLLIVASVIAVIASRLRVPYTVALVIGGLVLGSLHHLPALQIFTEARRPDWLTPNIVLVLFLPPLLFSGSIKIQSRHLRENWAPIFLLANVGVLAATLITGFAIRWVFGLPVMIALLFGSIISATDPVSVISIFEETGVGKRLSVIVEGESLFNDGTAVVLFGLLLSGIASGRLGVAAGIEEFLVEVLGAVALGSLLGYLFSKITQRIDEPRVEITLTMVLAYSSYLAAQSLHFSGVIATVAAGLIMGNFGARVGMSGRTQLALWSFWDYAAFVINSLLFLLIGMQVRIADLVHGWRAVLLAVAAVLLGRAISIYALTPLSNLFGESIPLRWQHLMVWGGLRGALALTLVLSLAPSFPYRSDLLAWTFGVVAFSIVVQGLTIKPLLRILGLKLEHDSDYDRARVWQIALTSARTELDNLYRNHAVSGPLYARFRRELDSGLKQLESDIAALYEENKANADSEIRTIQTRLRAAEKNAIYRAHYDGLISQPTAESLLDAADKGVGEISARILLEEDKEEFDKKMERGTA